MTTDGRRHEQADRRPPAVRSPAERSGEHGHLIRGDDRFHVDKQLVADLANLNTRVGRYVLEHLNADTGRATPSSPDDEQALGMQLVRAGLAILERADKRRRAANRDQQEPT